MADVENTNVSADPTHQEGTEHIKEQVFGGEQQGRDSTVPEGRDVAPAETSSEPRNPEAENTMTTDRDDNENKNLPDTDTSGEKTDKPPKSDGKGKPMENKDAIPTAGGQKLGEKHWGESEIVPDNPKPRESDAGVSGGGQPNSETAKNTAANTGAPGQAGQGEEKQKFTDKIKDKLHMGKKD